jgi:hypothetical protein
MAVTAEARERFSRIAGIVLPFGIKLKARMQKLGKRRVRVKCPQHATSADQGPYVHAVLAGARDHIHMACEDAACFMRMME